MTRPISNIFPDQNNILNKGYLRRTGALSRGVSGSNLNILSYLPSIEVVAQYESLYPGTLKYLLDLAKQERDKQYQIDRLAISKDVFCKISTSFITLVSFGLICFATIKILMMQMQSVAVKFFICGFGSMFGMSLAYNLLVYCKFKRASKFDSSKQYSKRKYNSQRR